MGLPGTGPRGLLLLSCLAVVKFVAALRKYNWYYRFLLNGLLQHFAQYAILYDVSGEEMLIYTSPA